MDRDTFNLLEGYMTECMQDSAHDREHVYRVLYTALDIARTEQGVDMDVLISACLLHDIGRQEQFQNPALDHAVVGAEKAHRFMTAHGFPADMVGRVAECIRAHRFRTGEAPRLIEARILFDADKVDVSGAIGIARTLIYQGHEGEPLYSLLPDGRVSDGSGDAVPSFMQEYRFKLEKLYERFCTARGAQIARARQSAAAAFYEALLSEARAVNDNGHELLEDVLG